MKVIICGGRNFDDRNYVMRVLNALNEQCRFTLVIEGGARGADTLAREWAKRAGIPCQTFKADWNGFAQKRAGKVRNLKMLREGKPDMVIGFPGGIGTAHMLRISTEAKVRVVDLSHHYRSLGA